LKDGKQNYMMTKHMFTKKKNEFDNAQKEDLNRRRLIAPKQRNVGKENIPSEQKRFDNFTAAANPENARDEFNNEQTNSRRMMVSKN